MIFHPPVLLNEVIELLKPERGIFVDATLGGGGHAEALLKASERIKLIGIDRDEEAIEIAIERLKVFGSRVSIYHANFSQIADVLKAENVEKVNGFLFDLGTSHFQLRGNRGFSVWREEPLDMRMDRRQKLCAKDVVNKLSEGKLSRIILEYGEEGFAKRIARAIVTKRKGKPIETTKELADIVKASIPRRFWIGKHKHPAIKTFQAIRIYLNKELFHIEMGLNQAIEYLSCNGRIAVISFHSIEDRLVKNTLKVLSPITKKPIVPSNEEVKKNPASRSAKLRVAQKLC